MDELCEIRSEFPLCRDHPPQGTQLGDERFKSCGVRSIGYHMPDSNAPVGLFEGEMAKVGNNKSEFLFVIGPPGRLPGILHKDDALRHPRS